MGYSKEDKEDILARFHASGMSMRAACARLEGFPASPRTLSGMLRDEEAGLLCPPAVEVPGRCEGRVSGNYPVETKREAVKLLADGLEARFVARRLNIGSAALVRSWAASLAATGAVTAHAVPSGAREGIVSAYLGGEPVAAAAARLGVARSTAYSWLRAAGVKMRARGPRAGKEGAAMAEKAERAAGAPGEWARAWGGLPADPAERARAAEVRLAEALAVLDVLKAPGPSCLTSSERYRAGEMARAACPAARVDDVLADFGMARSTYFSQAAREAAPDKYAALRARVRASFEASGGRYGSESVWADLRRGPGEPVAARDLEPGDMETPVRVSEKVVRRVMAEEGLVPVQAKAARGRYSSYAGETDERPANLPLREDGTHDFGADAPGELVVTDVTEFALDGFKVYFSPVLDCHDGFPVSWRASPRPDDDLTAGSLEDALALLPPGCAVHTDGGGNYRSARWKKVCEENGLVRSMSRKAKSPDNARAEGFFGTLKQEFFYARDWKGVSRPAFIRALNEYMMWYRDKKIKKSLGWRTLAEHRASLAGAA